ncbi:succinate dehydrogenase assembly factor 2 [Halioxenophilus sp. WMMB6]|uniref:FAD assembly factor SdhE n=1 Tax=Halioxenophilus sp. WMMB6 TaxID=3073815 RepID=UPI00295E6E7D|nr:succinate dehydrogenase assembly factor 2 [Halioxenophilus sp. WMMB6]
MEKNRLYWASRRGMLELDLVLQPFLDNHYDDLPQSDKELFWALLESEDQDMFSWFIDKVDPADPNILKIVKIIRAHTGLQPGD